MTVFAWVMDLAHIDLDDELAASFAKYSTTLADQGLFIVVSKYLKGYGNSKQCCEL